MLINWVNFAVGMLFGLIPPLRLLNTGCRFLPFDELWARVVGRPEDDKETPGQRSRRRRWWKLPLVWIDPLRGYVVGDMLCASFSPAPDANFLQAQLPVLALLGALMLVLAVQTKGRLHERESLSPGGFMAGLMVVMMPATVSVGAIVVGLSTAVALQRYSFGYWAAAVMTAGIGFVFMGPDPMVGVYTMMVSAPAWMSWLRGTTLVTPVRC